MSELLFKAVDRHIDESRDKWCEREEVRKARLAY